MIPAIIFLGLILSPQDLQICKKRHRQVGGKHSKTNSKVAVRDYLYLFILYRHHNVDISVAVSTDAGLITPIVFNADKKVRSNFERLSLH